ncbi:MAG: nuclear transport factor 2 family protein [Pricia sp.]
MKNYICTICLTCLTALTVVSAQSEDVKIIKSILAEQQKAWSDNDLEGFMQGYWESDSLTYYSRGKITRGWQTTLDNYKKGYPSKADTGTLNFEIDAITQINEDAYYVMGKYFLTREVGDANGTFMIIFKRIEGEWKIVADSSC